MSSAQPGIVGIGERADQADGPDALPLGTTARLLSVGFPSRNIIYIKGRHFWYDLGSGAARVEISKVSAVELVSLEGPMAKSAANFRFPVSDDYPVGQLAHIEVEGYDKGATVYFLGGRNWHPTDGSGGVFEMQRITKVTPLIAARPELVMPGVGVFVEQGQA